MKPSLLQRAYISTRNPVLEQRIADIRMLGYKNAICACIGPLDSELANISSLNKEKGINTIERAMSYLDRLFHLLGKDKDEDYTQRWKDLKESTPTILKDTQTTIYQRLKELKEFYKTLFLCEQLSLDFKQENI